MPYEPSSDSVGTLSCFGTHLSLLLGFAPAGILAKETHICKHSLCASCSGVAARLTLLPSLPGRACLSSRCACTSMVGRSPVRSLPAPRELSDWDRARLAGLVPIDRKHPPSAEHQGMPSNLWGIRENGEVEKEKQTAKLLSLSFPLFFSFNHIVSTVVFVPWDQCPVPSRLLGPTQSACHLLGRATHHFKPVLCPGQYPHHLLVRDISVGGDEDIGVGRVGRLQER